MSKNIRLEMSQDLFDQAEKQAASMGLTSVTGMLRHLLTMAVSGQIAYGLGPKFELLESIEKLRDQAQAESDGNEYPEDIRARGRVQGLNAAWDVIFQQGRNKNQGDAKC